MKNIIATFLFGLIAAVVYADIDEYNNCITKTQNCFYNYARNVDFEQLVDCVGRKVENVEMIDVNAASDFCSSPVNGYGGFGKCIQYKVCQKEY